ncbi:hypothetical protein SAMN04487821_111155 [Enterococcus malodoratus]|uniref:hypothetical protein n=1 Tax=Enterococcus malodoratus TaxID=71451 RepID=UPI0008D504A5|nr:hypothetical protein [Enterococcus malodoratus]SET40877.1 hypothetical protein SAMN04487821_111155 [Enterococcus malodoratus]
MNLIYLVVLFLASHIYLEKGKLPAKMQEVKLRYILFGSLGAITLAMVLGVLLNIASFLVMTVTICSASLIAYKYRSKFDEMERGKSV